MITIKIGGSVVDNLHSSTIGDIKKVVEQEGVILVHGGGKEVTKVTEQLGKEPKFVVSPSGNKKSLYRQRDFRNFYNGDVRKNKIKQLFRCYKKMESMQWDYQAWMEKQSKPIERRN